MKKVIFYKRKPDYTSRDVDFEKIAMEIHEEFVAYDLGQITIKKAIYIDVYRIKLEFLDGVERIVDFEPFLKKSNHPAIRKYLDQNQFVQFDIVNGNLNWNDYDMIFPVSDLYDGKIS